MREIVPEAEARAVGVPEGCHVIIENVAGGQVGDLFAFGADDPSERLSAAHTRAENWSLFPAVGQVFTSNRRRPVLTLLEDSTPGCHDMLVPACDPQRYERLGAPGHRSCSTNLVEALARHGIPVGEVPQPVNLFMPVPVGPGGSLELRVSPARPGDRVVLRAEMPLVMVVSACPQDLVPLNSGGGSELAIEL